MRYGEKMGGNRSAFIFFLVGKFSVYWLRNIKVLGIRFIKIRLGFCFSEVNI